MNAFWKLYDRDLSRCLIGAVLIISVVCDGGLSALQAQSEAFKETRKAAYAGDAEAQRNLGNMYAKGEGVPKNDEEAAKWYRKAEESAVSKRVQLEKKIVQLESKLVQAQSEAFKKTRKAAYAGDAEAQFSLGNMYYNGEGVPENDAEAYKWFRKAAEQGYAKAQYNLGVMYDKGEGVPKNDVEAYKWWLLVAARGDEEAKEAVNDIEGSMTTEQIAEGQRRAAAHHAKESQ